MVEKFKEEINRQHAPQKLVDDTLRKIHTQKKKKWKPVYMAPVGLAVAAALLLVVNVTTDVTEMNYNIMEEEMIRDIILEENITIEYQEAGEGTIMIRSSAVETVAPESLLAGEVTDINGYSVYLGKNETDHSYSAAFVKEKEYYYLYTKNASQKEFESFLKKFLNK